MQTTDADDKCLRLTLMTDADNRNALGFFKDCLTTELSSQSTCGLCVITSDVYRISSKHCGKYSYYVITLLLKWSNCVCIYTEIVTELSKSVIVSSTSVCNLKILLYKLVVCELVQKLSYKLFHHLSK